VTSFLRLNVLVPLKSLLFANISSVKEGKAREAKASE